MPNKIFVVSIVNFQYILHSTQMDSNHATQSKLSRSKGKINIKYHNRFPKVVQTSVFVLQW